MEQRQRRFFAEASDNVKSGLSIIGELSGHSDGIHILAFIESNQDLVVSAGLDKRIGVWNIKEMKLMKQFLVGHSEKIIDLLISPNSN